MKAKPFSFLLNTAIAVILVSFILASTPFDEKTGAAEQLPIGTKAPMLQVPVKDVSGKMLTLGQVADTRGLLVIFSCNTCPWVAAWEDRYNPIANLAQENNIGVIFLNPNTSARDNGDGFEDMQQRAKKSGYQFYYALDKQSKIAEAFGATRTPHVYLFNSDLKLVYRGAIDDNARAELPDEVKKPYLKNAIKALATGKKIEPQTTKSFGCGIKWPEG